jgi:quinol monooxygenase YgiN
MQARIRVGESPFTLINTFSVAPERQQAIVDSLSAFTKAHASAMPGFVAASVHASLDGRRVVNYVQWLDADYLAAMLARPESQQHLAEVAGLADHIDPIPYRVAFVGSLDAAGAP